MNLQTSTSTATEEAKPNIKTASTESIQELSAVGEEIRSAN